MKVFKYIIICFIIVIILSEIFLQIFIRYFDYRNDWESRYDIWKKDSILGWYNKSDLFYKIKGFEFLSRFSTDSKGFRKNTVSSFNDSNIIFIGDSFVQACEVNDEDVFSNLIQYMIKYRIINAGVRGYGIDQSYLLLKRIINKETKKVILFICDNDFRDILYDNYNTLFPLKPKFELINDTLHLFLPMQSEKQNNKQQDNKLSEIKTPLHFTYKVSSFIKTMLYKSVICRIIINSLQFTDFGKWLYEKNLINQPVYMNYEWKLISEDIMNKSYIIMDKLMDKYISLCKKNNAELIVFLIPSSFIYEKNLINQINALKKLYDFKFDMEQVFDSIYSIMSNKNIKCIYPLKEFRENVKKQTLTFHYDKHWNTNGHKLVANILIKELK